MQSFWQQLKKPILILAPMDDVTDSAFRQTIAHLAKPDLFFTEFVNCDGLCSDGREKLMPRLSFTPTEHPIVAQIWGINPDTYFQSAKLIEKLGFDGIDINMGCPVKDVMKIGACSALINNHSLAAELIEATKKGAPNLPISVKTRLGIKEIQTEEWITFLLSQDLAAIIIHGRTSKEMSKVPSHWDEIAKAVKLRNSINPNTLIIGNGDVNSLDEAKLKVEETGVDGVMIGRGVLHNPWVFSKLNHQPTISDRIEALLFHLKLYEQSSDKPFQIMKKFFKAYIGGFEGALELRNTLMETTSPQEVRIILNRLSNQKLTAETPELPTFS